MKAFVSWSSGKDCTYALYKYLQNSNNKVFCLLNMVDDDTEKSRSHGVSKGIIRRQASKMNIELIQQPTLRGNYEENFRKTVSHLKAQGVDAGVFGDIYLEAHREWIERVCGETGVQPVFPLWGMDTAQLIEDFVTDGFRAITVSVRKNVLPKQFLGNVFDERFLQKLREIRNIDLCGENGEYHTFVFDGPLFSEAVSFQTGLISEDDKHYFLELI